MTAPQRILITGASGFLGWELCRQAAASWDVVALVNAHPLQVPQIASEACDLTDHDRLTAVLRRTEPHVVLHAAAESHTQRCEQDPQTSHAINVTATAILAGLCAEHRIRLVFTSTDMVFDGEHAPYQESDSVSPINVYGRQKAAAEEAVLRASHRFTVCRLPLLFGHGPPGTANFLSTMLDALRKGQPVSLFEDEYRTPLGNRAAAEALLTIVARDDLDGVWHLGGRERVSRWELGCRAAQALGVPTESVVRCRQADVKSPAPRPRDLSLDSRRAHAELWDAPRTIEEQLQDAPAS